MNPAPTRKASWRWLLFAAFWGLALYMHTLANHRTEMLADMKKAVPIRAIPHPDLPRASEDWSQRLTEILGAHPLSPHHYSVETAPQGKGMQLRLHLTPRHEQHLLQFLQALQTRQPLGPALHLQACQLWVDVPADPKKLSARCDFDWRVSPP